MIRLLNNIDLENMEDTCSYVYKRGFCKGQYCKSPVGDNDETCNFHDHPIFNFNDLHDISPNTGDLTSIANWIRTHPEHFPDYEMDYDVNNTDQALVCTYLVQIENERAVCDYEHAKDGYGDADIYYNQH